MEATISRDETEFWMFAEDDDTVLSYSHDKLEAASTLFPYSIDGSIEISPAGFQAVFEHLLNNAAYHGKLGEHACYAAILDAWAGAIDRCRQILQAYPVDEDEDPVIDEPDQHPEA